MGSLLRSRLSSHPDLRSHFGVPPGLRLTDVIDFPDRSADEQVHIGDLADADFVEELFAGGDVHAVIHMAGHPREADWDVILNANLRSAINLWEASRRHKVDRFLYAISNHAVGFYPKAEKIDSFALPRPDSRYGVTKVFSEQLGFLYAHKYGVRSFGIRIGMFLQSQRPIVVFRTGYLTTMRFRS